MPNKIFSLKIRERIKKLFFLSFSSVCYIFPSAHAFSVIDQSEELKLFSIQFYFWNYFWMWKFEDNSNREEILPQRNFGASGNCIMSNGSLAERKEALIGQLMEVRGEVERLQEQGSETGRSL